MNFSKLKGYALAAVLGASLVPAGAFAGITAGAGDVILGFRATGGTGASTNYTVKLGQASQFTGASSVLELSLGDVGADLEAIYGANWRSRTDLFFGVMGATDSFAAVGGDPAKTLYASKARPSAATTATAWNRANTAQTSATSQVNGMRSGLAQGTTSSNSTVAVTRATTDLNSWSSYVSGTASFGIYNPTIEATAGSSADFFRMTPGTGAGDHLGTFSLGTDGTVRFVPASLVADLAAGGVISVSTPVVFVNSGATSASVTLTRTGGLGAASVQVDTATVTGGAATPADFAALSAQVVNFAVGQTSAVVEITLTGAVNAATKAFNVVISNPTVATLGTTTTASVRIRGSAADVTAPTLALTAPVVNAILSSTKAAAFTGTVTDVGGVVETLTIAFNGGAAESVTFAAGKFTKSYANEAAATAAGIIPGSNSVVVTATDFDGNVSSVTRSFFYEKLVPVTVTSTNGLLTFTPKLGGTTLAPTAAIGRSYSVSAKANTGFFFGSFSGTADISAPTASITPVTFESGETLVATFTASPFTSGATGVAGTYNGIVKGSGAADTQANAGILNVLVTVNTGAFTGKLNVDGVITPVAGVFDHEDGTFSTPSVNNGTAYDLTLDFATKVVSGTITKFKRGVEVAQVNVNVPQAYVTTAFTAATYNVAFDAPQSPAPDLIPGEYPEGNGYGTLTIGLKADAKLVGKLADGTAYTSSSVVCKPVSPATENTVPVFASFASATGSLVGEALVTSTSVDSSAAFRWFKKENAGQYYPYGFANGATTGLSIDIAAGGLTSSAVNPTIVLNTSTVSFTGGSLDTFGDALFNVDNLVITSAANPKLTFNATTKQLTGTYTAAGKINTLGGIVVGTTAYGYILTPLPMHTDGTGEGGKVTLVP